MLSGLSRLVRTGDGGNASSSSAATAAGATPSVLATPRRRVISQALADPYSAFVRDWEVLERDLTSPDQAALHHGISRTDIPERLDRFAGALVAESTALDEAMDGMGPCMEFMLKRDGERSERRVR